MIASFWADVDIEGTGTVWFRDSTSTELLTRASTEIGDAFPVQAANGFTATKLFIATWDHVGYFNTKTDLVCVENKSVLTVCYMIFLSVVI